MYFEVVTILLQTCDDAITIIIATKMKQVCNHSVTSNGELCITEKKTFNELEL